jgi:hypothetical protein
MSRSDPPSHWVLFNRITRIDQQQDRLNKSEQLLKELKQLDLSGTKQNLARGYVTPCLLFSAELSKDASLTTITKFKRHRGVQSAGDLD